MIFTHYTIGGIPFVGICEGPDGNMWGADSYAVSVVKITPSGDFTIYTLPTGNSGSQQMTSDGTYVWIAGNNGAWRVDMSGGSTWFSIPGFGTFYGVTFDGTNLWFGGNGNNIAVINTSGSLIHTVSLPAAVDAIVFAGGYIWVLLTSGALRQYNLSYSLISNSSGLYSGNGLTSDGANIWATDTSTRYQEVNMSTLAINFYTPAGFEGAQGIGFDGTYVYIGDVFHSLIWQISPSSPGSPVSFSAPYIGDTLQINPGPSNSIWLADSTEGVWTNYKVFMPQQIMII